MSIKLPKIFLDSCDVEETRSARGILGFLDGQTTNPTLVAKNPQIVKYMAKGKKLTEKDLLKVYKETVVEISREIAGPVSVEVYADEDTKAPEMLKQAEELSSWGRNIYVKLPAITEGFKAAAEFTKKGGKVNMTLVFDQLQAAAAYSATLEKKQPAIVSPFLGRWDDRGFRGLDLLKNIIKTYKQFDKSAHPAYPISVLAASVRNLGHLYGCINLGADIITLPFNVIREWVGEEKWIPDANYRIESHGLKTIKYQNVPFRRDFTQYKVNIEAGSLLEAGLKKFVSDWKSVLAK